MTPLELFVTGFLGVLVVMGIALYLARCIHAGGAGEDDAIDLADEEHQ